MSLFDLHEPPEIEAGPLPPPDFPSNVVRIPRVRRETPTEHAGWLVSAALCVSILAVFACIAIAHWISGWMLP